MPKLSFIVLTFCTTITYAQSDYLTQPKPSHTPQVFAPGIVSTGAYERDLAVSPDGKYLFFTSEQRKTGNLASH